MLVKELRDTNITEVTTEYFHQYQAVPRQQ